jgi:hypothetical protein
MAKEMAKTLTYYAINNGKPAFAHRGQQGIPHGHALLLPVAGHRGFMDLLGIGYERRFPLSAEGVDMAANSNVALSFFNNKIFLDLADARDRLGFFPFKKGAAVEYVPSNPLMAVVGGRDAYRIYYGNRNLTELQPEYFEYDDTEHDLTLVVDGRPQTVPFGRIVPVDRAFEVAGKPDCRVNIIGFSRPGSASEEGVAVRREDIASRFSVDRGGRVYGSSCTSGTGSRAWSWCASRTAAGTAPWPEGPMRRRKAVSTCSTGWPPSRPPGPRADVFASGGQGKLFEKSFPLDPFQKPSSRFASAPGSTHSHGTTWISGRFFHGAARRGKTAGTRGSGGNDFPRAGFRGGGPESAGFGAAAQNHWNK